MARWYPRLVTAMPRTSVSRLRPDGGERLERGRALVPAPQRRPPVHDDPVGADQVQPRLGEVALAEQPVGGGLVDHSVVLGVVAPDLDVNELGSVVVPTREVLDDLGDRSAEPARAVDGRREDHEGGNAAAERG